MDQKSDVSVWILLSIVSSTSLILTLKQVGRHVTCSYTITLSTFHFLSTWLGLEILAYLGKIRRVEVPLWKRWLLGFLVVSSIVTMNFNLKTNSIGFYQMSKLVCIPYVILYEFFAKGTKRSFKEIMSLIVVLTGIAMFSISDVEVNRIGTIFAIAAVLSTAHNQMMTGSLQKEFGITGPELQYAVIAPEFIMGLIASIAFEFKGPQSFIAYDFTLVDMLLMIATCVFSIGVNVATFGLIGKTSAVTYQVVGHFKTVLLLILGYIFFPSTWPSAQQMLRAVFGIITALAGVFWYSYLKIKGSDLPAAISQSQKL